MNHVQIARQIFVREDDDDDDDDGGGANRRVCVDGWMDGWVAGWMADCRDRTDTRRTRKRLGYVMLDDDDDAGGSSIVAVRRARGRGGGASYRMLMVTHGCVRARRAARFRDA